MSDFIDDVKRQSAVAHCVQAYLKYEERVQGDESPQFIAGREYAQELAHEARRGANPYMLSTAMVGIMSTKDIGLLHSFCVHLQKELALA